MSDLWTHKRWEIHKFVEVRGDIAHKGSDAPKVSREDAGHFLSIVLKSITDTDNAVYEHLKDSSLLGRAPPGAKN